LVHNNFFRGNGVKIRLNIRQEGIVLSQDVLNQILTKLTVIETDLRDVKEDVKSLKSKFELFESNQQTFHELLRETRLEYDTRDRISSERHEELINRLSFIEADVDHAINKTNRNERELARVKKQIENNLA